LQPPSQAPSRQVSPDWCTRLARSIAPIRDVSTADEDTDGIPDSARLVDILGLDVRALTWQQAITARWRSCGRSTVAVVGRVLRRPVGDRHQEGRAARADRGTTGSGKSELLQSLVASLAVANRPDELTFVLIDYKGGSAFADCARLPHTVGMVTDLSPTWSSGHSLRCPPS